MEILFISKSQGRRARIRFGWSSLLAVVLVVAVTAGVVARFGYQAGAEAMAVRILDDPPESMTFWQRELASQRREIGAARTSQEANFNALARRVGKLQAHMTRVNALGGRLTETAALPEGEFDFTLEPALGGPQPGTEQPSAELAEIVRNIERLTAALEDHDEQLIALETVLRERDLQAQILPTGRPVSTGWLSSGFGKRADPVSGKQEFHRGIDFAGRAGADIRAVAAGVVTWSGPRYGYGELVELNHGAGYVTRYSHNKKNLVFVGDKVERGQLVAKMGATGRATGPHVHFEVVHNGRIVNPSRYIRKAHK